MRPERRTGRREDRPRRAPRLTPLVAVLSTALALAGPGCGGDPGDDDAPSTAAAACSGAGPGPMSEIVLLHTTDLHDNLDGWSPSADYTPLTKGDDATHGGMARLAARVAAQRRAAGGRPVLLVDAGDFSQGTLFTWLALTDAPMLDLMGRIGYDAITLGNHEFDWTPDGLAGMLYAATQLGFSVPILASNIVFSATSSGDDALEAFQTAGLIRGKLVKTLSNGLRVGLFGLLGNSAVRDTALADPVTFEDTAVAAQRVVDELRQKDKVDLVICLSHGGVESTTSGDDIVLAKGVTGIDVIVGGHTHRALKKPITVGKTTIVESGAFGRYLGKLVIRKTQGGVAVVSHKLIELDDSEAGDEATEAIVDGHVATLDSMLAPDGLGYSQVLAETSFDLAFPSYREAPLGDLVTDAYRSVVSTLETSEPVDLVVESGGILWDAVLRGRTGKLWFADLYRALPLGIGTDGIPGFPLVSFFVTGEEVRAGMELTAAAKDVLGSNDFFMQVSGVEMTYDPTAPAFGRVTSVEVQGVAVDPNRCYKLVTNYYVGMLLGLVQYVTGGAVSITPKEKGCTTAVADLSTRIVDRDPATPGVQQLKGWQALVSTVASFSDTDGDGVPDVPSIYAAPQGRIQAK
jgi:5'-nucleotidase / UDP-sugar diphosphatase